MKVSIVIPAHNEEKRIGKTLEDYTKFFRNKKEEIEKFELLVVLNACEDNTKKIVKKVKKRFKEIKYLDFKRGGKGFAIREGFKDALKRDFDLIGFIDADMSTPPKSFYFLIKNIKNADGAIANRWDKRSVFNYSLLKKIRSRIYNIYVRILFLFPPDFEDTQCGAKIFKSSILEKNIGKLISSDFNFDVALLFCLKNEDNAKIKSLPTFWEEKGGSKVFSIKSPLRMFLSAIRLRLFHSPFKFIIKFYGKITPEKLKLHNILKYF